MYIETENLIICDFIELDTEALLEINYYEQVLKYDPAFIKPKKCHEGRRWQPEKK